MKFMYRIIHYFTISLTRKADSEIVDNPVHELHENEYFLSLCPDEPAFCMLKNEHDAPFWRAQLRVRSLPPHFRQRLGNIQFLFA